jgi:hypothetical protein
MKTRFFLLFLLGCLITSCNSNDDESNSSEESMTIIKDGITFEGLNFNNTLILFSQAGEGVRRLDLRSDLEDGVFILSISNWDFQNPPQEGVIEKIYDTNVDEAGPNTACQEINNINFCDEALISWSVGVTAFVSELGQGDDQIGNITITNNNPESKTVSGTFSAEIRDINAPENTPNTVVSGIFTNLSYTVFN